MIDIKAVIIEDEEKSRNTLKNMLTDFCEGVEIVGMGESIADGVKSIIEHKPDLVFLDIELPNGNGFELFNYFPLGHFDVIFTTAYDQFAVQAFKMSAIDYLLKPIDLEDLRNGLQKVRDKKHGEFLKEKIETLRSNLNNTFHKLALPSSDGLIFIELNDIIRCEASGNYTKFHLTNGSSHLISKTLGHYEEILKDSNFFRTNRADLVNLNHIQKYTRQKRATILLSDGTTLNIAEGRKNSFLEIFEGKS